MADTPDTLKVRKGKIFVISLVILAVMVVTPFIFSVIIVPLARSMVQNYFKNKGPEEEQPAPAAPEPAVAGTPSTAVEDPAKRRDVDRLIEESVKQRYAGRFDESRRLLLNALLLLPEDPAALAALAQLYESFDDKASARQTWQTLADLGPARAGRYYAEAAEKARLLSQAPLPAASGVAANRVPRIFSIGETSLQKDGSQIYDDRQVLKIDILLEDRNRKIDPAKLRIHVYFYDMMSNNEIVVTRREFVKAAFVSGAIDWKNGAAERMQAVYEVPRGRLQRELKETGLMRRYFGYIVQVYYENRLQDLKASPEQLAMLYPAKENLTP